LGKETLVGKPLHSSHRFARNAQAAVSVLVLMLLTGCSGPTGVKDGSDRLRISGSTSMTPLLEDLARAYQTAHPNVSFEVRGGDSAMGVKDLHSGDTDLAAVSWTDPSEPALPGLQAVPIARDGLMVIVHPSNKVSGLTILQLRSLYRGETLDWSALGGPTAEPEIISREDGSGDRLAFESMVMGGDRVTLDALVMPTAQTVADYVARHPAALGYISLAQARDDVRAVPIEGVIATPEQIQAGAYHLGRLLYLYADNDPSAAVRDFLDFVVSPPGQAIVTRYHAPLR
jgi:phosphate transport system substrate-binding protein